MSESGLGRAGVGWGWDWGRFGWAGAGWGWGMVSGIEISKGEIAPTSVLGWDLVYVGHNYVSWRFGVELLDEPAGRGRPRRTQQGNTNSPPGSRSVIATIM